MRPESERTSTRTLGSSSSRTATAPETVATSYSPPGRRSTSSNRAPETVRALNAGEWPSATVTSPETVSQRNVAIGERTSTSPEAGRTRTRPPTPSSVTEPDADVNDDSPTIAATTTGADEVTTMTSVVGGTVRPTRARRRPSGKPSGVLYLTSTTPSTTSTTGASPSRRSTSNALGQSPAEMVTS